MNTEFKKLFKGQAIKQYSKGDVLIYEADQIDHISYLTSGLIKVYTVVNTDVQRIIYIYRAGDVFPLTTYLSGSHIARFFYECLTPSVTRCITTKKFEEKVADNYELGEALVQYTTNIDRQFLRRVNDMVANTDNLSKVSSLLNFLYQKFGTDKAQPVIEIPIGLKDLANMCGLSREETTKCLEKFRSQGIVYSASVLLIDKKAFKTKT
jgi:CRP-like cAMP-binding protein